MIHHELRRSILASLWLAFPTLAQSSPAWVGPWRSTEGEVVCLQPSRLAKRNDKGFEAHLARPHEQGIELNESGIAVVVPLTVEGDELRMGSTAASKPELYQRLAEPPADFEPAAAALGTDEARASTIKEIKKELRTRARKDQQARNRSGDDGRTAKLDADNTKYLRQTALKFGWIDVLRFGVEAANDAWLLVVHSGDLALMLAALPVIEADVTAKRLADGNNYASLYDRVQMHLGRRQRFGTQVVQEKGRFVVFALEDREKVDTWREQLRMQPLAENLKMQEKWTGGPIGIQDW